MCFFMFNPKPLSAIQSRGYGMPKTRFMRNVVVTTAAVTLFFMMNSMVFGQAGPNVAAAASGQPALGEVKRIQGQVFKSSPLQGGSSPVQEGMQVYIDDTLFTEPSSKAWWNHSASQDQRQFAPLTPSNISMGEKSRFEFLRFDKQNDAEFFVGEMPRGLIRFIKELPRTTPQSSFTVTTPTALIEVMLSDRAADFVIEVNNDRRTTIYGIWGAVKVRHISTNFQQERIVRSCQKVDVDIDKEPSPVQGVSSSFLKQLITRTTIPYTLPEDVPNCDSPPPVRIEEPVVEEFIPDGCPCPPYQELVGNTCVSCPSSRSYDPASCSCSYRCRSDHHCRRCEWCDNGICRPKRCPPGEWLNHESCRCERECHKQCPPGFWLNPKTCSCERKCDKHCPPGQWLNPKTCECESHCNKNCLPGQRLNKETCQCESKCQKQCGPNEWLNHSTCECVPKCRKHCPEGQHLNKELCRCEGKPSCKKVCPRESRLDQVSCECIPIIKKEDQHTGCKSDSECGHGLRCFNGKCVQTGTKDHDKTKPTSDWPKPHIENKFPIESNKPVIPKGQDGPKFQQDKPRIEIQKPDFQKPDFQKPLSDPKTFHEPGRQQQLR
jgi:hypothetical protein